MFIKHLDKITHCHLCNKALETISKNRRECKNCIYNNDYLCFICNDSFDLGIEINNNFYMLTYNSNYDYQVILDLSKEFGNRKIFEFNWNFNLEPNIKNNLEILILKCLNLKVFE